MSTIGPAGYAAQIASSLARTHRGDADSARSAEAGQRQTVQAAHDGVEAIDEATKAEMSTDRDPDGRRGWEFHSPPEPESTDEPPAERPRISDSLDAVGGFLDIEI